MTSRPVLSWPSVCRITRPRSPFSTSTCWASAIPSSHGSPACFMEESGGPRPAVVARDGYMVGLRFGHACRDRPDPDLGDELHAYSGPWVGILQVVDELREILYRVDVVVGRR